MPGEGAPAARNARRRSERFNASGSGKSGNVTPLGPMRTLPYAATARREVVVSAPGAFQPRPEGSPPRSGRRSPFVQQVTEGTKASSEGGRGAEQRGVAIGSRIVVILRATETNAQNPEIPPPA